MLDKYKDYKDIEAPDDLRNSVIESMREYKPEAKSRLAVKRRVLIYAAMFVCLAMVVSAAVIINNRTQYMPGIGFTDRDFEIYAIPDIVEFGSLTIETVMRTKDAETGQSNLMIIITDNNYDPWGDWEDFQKHLQFVGNCHELTLTALDGTEYIINRAPDLPMMPVFFYEDFPEIDEFILAGVDSDGNNVSTEIMLAEGSFKEFYGYAKQNDTMITMKHVTRNSKVIIYEIIDETFKADYFFPEGNAFEEIFHLVGFDLYDETGDIFNRWTAGKSITGNEWFLMLVDRPAGRIEKVLTKGVTDDSLRNYDAGGLIYSMQEKHRQGYYDINEIYVPEHRIYIDIEVPVPDDGAKIEYAEPLVIFERNGIKIMISEIERKDDRLKMTRYQPEHIYEKANGNKIEFSVTLGNIDVDHGMFGGQDDENIWVWSSVLLTDENIENQSVKLFLGGLSFWIEGNWEIYFGD